MADPCNVNWNYTMLLPNEVYQHVFSFLNLASLKSARQVCPSWNGNVLKIMQERCKSGIIISNYKASVRFIETIKSASVIPFKYFTIAFKPGARFDKMNEIFDLIGPALTTLVIGCDCCVTDTETKLSIFCDDIITILKRCQNVKHLALWIEGDKSNTMAMESISDFENGELFKSIKELSVFEPNAEQVNFSAAKTFFPLLAKCMPNLVEICHLFEAQLQLDEFMLQLETNRKEGCLTNLKSLRMLVKRNTVIYLTKKHWQLLLGLKLDLESAIFANFYLSGCANINAEDISTVMFYEFFCGSQSLKHFSLITSKGGSIDELEFPPMRSLTQLRILVMDSENLLEKNKNLAKLLPKLEILQMYTKWTPQLQDSYPCLTIMGYTSAFLTIPSQEINNDKCRVVEFRHSTADYYPRDYWVLYFKWFPGIKKISAQVKIHFGVLSLLRGLCGSSIEEIAVNVDCAFCKLDENEMALQPRNNYESCQITTRPPQFIPFPELRTLKITSSYRCCVGFRYLYDSDVMKLLLRSAPKLKSIIIVKTYKVSNISDKVITSYNRSQWIS